MTTDEEVKPKLKTAFELSESIRFALTAYMRSANPDQLDWKLLQELYDDATEIIVAQS